MNNPVLTSRLQLGPASATPRSQALPVASTGPRTHWSLGAGPGASGGARTRSLAPKGPGAVRPQTPRRARRGSAWTGQPGPRHEAQRRGKPRAHGTASTAPTPRAGRGDKTGAPPARPTRAKLSSPDAPSMSVSSAASSSQGSPRACSKAASQKVGSSMAQSPPPGGPPHPPPPRTDYRSERCLRRFRPAVAAAPRVPALPRWPPGAREKFLGNWAPRPRLCRVGGAGRGPAREAPPHLKRARTWLEGLPLRQSALPAFISPSVKHSNLWLTAAAARAGHGPSLGLRFSSTKQRGLSGRTKTGPQWSLDLWVE